VEILFAHDRILIGMDNPVHIKQSLTQTNSFNSGLLLCFEEVILIAFNILSAIG